MRYKHRYFQLKKKSSNQMTNYIVKKCSLLIFHFIWVMIAIYLRLQNEHWRNKGNKPIQKYIYSNILCREIEKCLLHMTHSHWSILLQQKRILYLNKNQPSAALPEIVDDNANTLTQNTFSYLCRWKSCCHKNNIHPVYGWHHLVLSAMLDSDIVTKSCRINTYIVAKVGFIIVSHGKCVRWLLIFLKGIRSLLSQFYFYSSVFFFIFVAHSMRRCKLVWIYLPTRFIFCCLSWFLCECVCVFTMVCISVED